MKVLVTGSSGHLGEALVRTLRALRHEVVGLDLRPSPFTTHVGSIVERDCVRRCIDGVTAVFHAATLHKPHVVTHSRQAFVDTNIAGTLTLLEEAVAAGAGSFMFTSTTSVFGDALDPQPGAPAAWIDETVVPVPKNIYGITKRAAEDFCQIFFRNHKLPCIVLRTSRFFPEEDDDQAVRASYTDGNVKANEYLYRRVDIEDVVSAHLLAWQRASSIGFETFVISAPTPFEREDLQHLRTDAPRVLAARVPAYKAEYERRGWRFFPSIGRVYVSARACRVLEWQPRYDFNHVLTSLRRGEDPRSPLARLVGRKGYHAERFMDGPYPVGSASPPR